MIYMKMKNVDCLLVFTWTWFLIWRTIDVARFSKSERYFELPRFSAVIQFCDCYLVVSGGQLGFDWRSRAGQSRLAVCKAHPPSLVWVLIGIPYNNRGFNGFIYLFRVWLVFSRRVDCHAWSHTFDLVGRRNTLWRSNGTSGVDNTCVLQCTFHSDEGCLE